MKEWEELAAVVERVTMAFSGSMSAGLRVRAPSVFDHATEKG